MELGELTPCFTFSLRVWLNSFKATTTSNYFNSDGIDFLINNAGFIHYANFDAITFDRVWQ